ncbi:unnamed protein product [Rotaria magnacalcarata]|uniref:Uncharacterized protein n=1 Tax=Rotaria magnacalcarata TaxID=392030 RepID=A0A819CE75_9BILA|nr:unnamed protein product [Rotaria magnacalcarata]
MHISLAIYLQRTQQKKNLRRSDSDAPLSKIGTLEFKRSLLSSAKVNVLPNGIPIHDIESLTVVWLDSNINQNEDCIDTELELRRLTAHLRIFTKLNECVEYLSSFKGKPACIFLIVSGLLGVNLMEHIREIEAIVWIYVFCENETFHNSWANKHSKIRGVFVEKERLFSSLLPDLATFSIHFTPISIFQSDENQKSIHDLSEETASFMWSQLLVHIILTMCDNRDDRAKKDLIDVCRTRYTYDMYEQNRITEFEKTYTTGQAIQWYTKDSFLYRCLNRAFRTMDIDIIYRFRFIIAELHEQLASLPRPSTSNLVVYRGQIISTKEMTIIEANQNKGFISMNTFLSTSENATNATGFASVNMNVPEGLESVLFRITISQTRQPFANIDALMEDCGAGYVVNLISTTEIEERCDALAQHYLNEIGTKPTLATLGRFLMMQGDYNRAQRYFQFLIDENVPELDNDGCAICYTGLGRIHDEKGEYEQALDYYQRVLTLQQSTLSKDHIDFSTTYNNIGTIQMTQGRYIEAIENFQHSLDIDLSHQNIDQTIIASTYNNMAQVYAEMQDHSKAIEYSEKSLKIQLEYNHDTIKHPSIAITYHNLGLLYEEKKQYENAIDYYEKALTIQKASLPPDHPSRIITESCLANVYFQSGKHQLGLEKCLKVLDTKLHQSPLNFPSLAKSYINLGAMYEELGDLIKAEENLKKSLHICKRHLTNHHTDTATTYRILGDVYDGMGEIKKALNNYQLSLKVFERQIPVDSTAMAQVYGRMSAVEQNQMKAIDYAKKGVTILLDADKIDNEALAVAYNTLGTALLEAEQLEEALIHCTKSLELARELVNGDENHLSLSIYYNNLGLILSQQGQIEKALEYQQKALDMFIEKMKDPLHPQVARMYNNLACSYQRLHNYELALGFFQKTVDSLKQPNTKNVRLLAETYIHIGSVYEDLVDWEKEVEYYKMVLDLQLTGLESNDIDLVSTYSLLASVYENREDYSIALTYLMPMLNIQTEILSKNDHELYDSHDQIGTCYYLNKDYQAALRHFKKALKIQRHRKKPLASICQSVGDTNKHLKKQKSASKYYRLGIHSLDEKEEANRAVDEHVDLCQLYRKLGILERQMNHFTKAMTNLQQSLNIYEKFLTNDNQYDEIVQAILESMAKVHEATGNMSMAEEYRKRKTVTDNA